MSRCFKIRAMVSGATLCAAVVLAFDAAPASAAKLSPVNHDFGTQQIATSGSSRAFTLTAGCQFELLGTCVSPESLSTSISLGTTDFAQTNDCPATLVGSLGGTSCTIWVIFSPKALGPRADSLRTGGPTAQLAGEGVPPAGTTPAKRKCQRKKKRKQGAKKGAASAKKKRKKRKCRKKKPRPVIEQI